MSRPTIVCLCGSTRFHRTFASANLKETLAGRIVLSIGCDTEDVHHHEDEARSKITKEQKEALDELHKRKIDLADEILVLNVGGYIGDSTKSEIAYAIDRGKDIRWLEPKNAVDLREGAQG